MILFVQHIGALCSTPQSGLCLVCWGFVCYVGPLSSMSGYASDGELSSIFMCPHPNLSPLPTTATAAVAHCGSGEPPGPTAAAVAHCVSGVLLAGRADRIDKAQALTLGFKA